MTQLDPDPYRDQKMSTDREREYRAELERYFEASTSPTIVKLQNFPKYVPRQSLTRFLSRAELFKKVLNVHGSIVECGVLDGGGFMTWAHLSSIFEPVNWSRQIIGFDTFEGFTNLGPQDAGANASESLKLGKLASDSKADIEAAAELYDRNRYLSHIPKCQLVKGDARKTVPEYLHANQHLIVSLLYLDMDVYEPTKVVIDALWSRMPKGAIIAFDEANAPNWPGETEAIVDSVGVADLKLQRFEWDSLISYAVIE